MEFHIGREWLEVRGSWSQMSSSACTTFLGDCYEMMGNLIYVNLSLWKGERRTEWVSQGLLYFNELEQLNKNEVKCKAYLPTGMFMTGRLMCKMNAPVSECLKLFCSVFEQLDHQTTSNGKKIKDGLSSGKLTAHTIIYHVHATIAKVLLHPTNDVPDKLMGKN